MIYFKFQPDTNKKCNSVYKAHFLNLVYLQTLAIHKRQLF